MGGVLDEKNERRAPIERGAAPPSGGLGGSFLGDFFLVPPQPQQTRTSLDTPGFFRFFCRADERVRRDRRAGRA